MLVLKVGLKVGLKIGFLVGYGCLDLLGCFLAWLGLACLLVC